MDDTPATPLLVGEKGPRFSSSSAEAVSHDATCSNSSSSHQESANWSAPGEGKAKDAAAQASLSDRSEKPQEGDGTDFNDRSSSSATAEARRGESEKQDAVAKRMFFPSARFPFSLKKTPAAAAAAATRGSSETPLDGDCAALIERLEQVVRCSGSSSVISAPTARLIEAARSLALIDGFDSKARREAQFEMLLASTSLTMVASREKLGEEIATMAKNLASEGAALLAKAGGLDQQNERSNDFLFCISISGALALLPYLPTQIPDWLQPVIAIGFGFVFYAASVGAILSFKATNRSQLKFADFLNTISFGGFSLLVTVFICSALASGNIILIVICALLLVAGHFYAWSRS